MNGLLWTRDAIIGWDDSNQWSLAAGPLRDDHGDAGGDTTEK
jgi:hypothetical protein